MFISKKKIINTSTLTIEEHRQIYDDLAVGNKDVFQRLVVETQSLYLVNQVQVDFPELSEQAADIIQDVFLKFQKQILNQRLAAGDIDLQNHLIELLRTDCKQALPTLENLQKNLKLSRKQYKALLVKLRAGDEEIIEHVYLNQFKRCISYLMHNCQVNYEDAYNSTMEALLEIRKDMIAGKIFYGNLDFYFTRRAKSKWYKMSMKRNTFQELNTTEEMDIEDDTKLESELYAEELKALVSEGLQKLCGDCKKIIRMYYYDEMSLKEIAELMDKKHEAVRKQATRCRDKLRSHLGEQFYVKFSDLIKE